MTTFRELEALVAVADMKSFEKAASHLHTSQSAVSRLIGQLEGGFERPLFSREQRATRLTMEGEEVLALARAILRHRATLLERINRPELVLSTLRVGATEAAAITWLPRFVSRLGSRHPQLHLDLDIASSSALHARLRDGLLDVAIVADVIRTTGMARFPVGTADMGWFCAPQLDLPDRLALPEFESSTLLIQGAMSGAGAQLSTWFQEQKLRPGKVIHTDSLMALLGMAAAGLGLASLPRAVAHEALARGALREVHLATASPSLDYIALVRIDTITAFHRSIVALARECCDFALPFQVEAASTSLPAQGATC
jgi:DNA-binding transcriptional LysR family regulator